MAYRFSACMRVCYDTCALLTEFRDGKLQVKPNPAKRITSNFLCPKGYHLPDWFHSGERLESPLIRTGEKPSDSFSRVPWDETLCVVAREMKRVIREHGARATLLHYYYGDRGLVNANFPHRLFNYLNASIVEDVICDRSGDEALLEVYGTSQGMDPRGPGKRGPDNLLGHKRRLDQHARFCAGGAPGNREVGNRRSGKRDRAEG